MLRIRNAANVAIAIETRLLASRFFVYRIAAIIKSAIQSSPSFVALLECPPIVLMHMLYGRIFITVQFMLRMNEYKLLTA